MDGTLIDSTPVVVRSWVTWALERGIDPKRLEGHHGVPAAQIVRGLVPEAEVEAAIARINALELADVEGITMLPGAAGAGGRPPAGRPAPRPPPGPPPAAPPPPPPRP